MGDYAASMAKALCEAEQGSAFGALNEVYTAWQSAGSDLPANAEEDARNIFLVQDKNKEKSSPPGIPIDPEFVIRKLKWEHSHQNVTSPWSSLYGKAPA